MDRIYNLVNRSRKHYRLEKLHLGINKLPLQKNMS